MAWFLVVGNWLLDWCFPFRCVGCGREGEWVCNLCATELQKLPKPSVPYDNQAALYQLGEGVVRNVVHHLKYLGADRAAETLVTFRAASIQGKYSRPTVVIPVPLSASRRKERGYNQAEVLARQVADTIGAPVLTRVLGKHSGDRSQVGRGRQERRQAAGHNFYVASSAARVLDKWRQAQILVVDDVVTTGSTLRSCCDLLQRYSSFPVQGLALAYQELEEKKKHP